MKDKSKEDKQALPYGKEDMFDVNTTASANDCTGLIPTPPKDNKEASSYVEIYKIPKPQEESPKDIERRSAFPKEGDAKDMNNK